MPTNETDFVDIFESNFRAKLFFDIDKVPGSFCEMTKSDMKDNLNYLVYFTSF